MFLEFLEFPPDWSPELFYTDIALTFKALKYENVFTWPKSLESGKDMCDSSPRHNRMCHRQSE